MAVKPWLVCALVLAPGTLAGCVDDGPFAYVFVRTDSITIANTHGNYPSNWTHWGNVTLTSEELRVQDLSDGESAGIRVHKLDEQGDWSLVQALKFRGGEFAGEIMLDQPGNYSISDVDRGGPGHGVHAKVTALAPEIGCERGADGSLFCDYYNEP